MSSQPKSTVATSGNRGLVEQEKLETLRAVLIRGVWRVRETKREIEAAVADLPPGERIIVDGHDTGETEASSARDSIGCLIEHLNDLVREIEREPLRDWRSEIVEIWREGFLRKGQAGQAISAENLLPEEEAS